MLRVFAFLLVIFFCLQCSPSKAPETSSTPSFPEQAYGELFEAVSIARIYPDGKTFADATPKAGPEEIRDAYLKQKEQADFDLQSFVESYFDMPPQIASDFESDPNRDAQEHIESLWEVLTREPASANGGTLLPLPFPYVVPGGRFREIYYWDSYFTMLGLKASGRYDMIENMVNNFAFLIDSVGFIPNGNRTYFISRSQPPFFAAMVNLLAETIQEPTPIYERFLPALEKEYHFWMKGIAALPEKGIGAADHVVRMEDGSILNRYWDNRNSPRTEMFADDLLTAEETEQTDTALYRNLRSACESGWDFSSRWLADGRTLATIETTEIIPVDLNALLFTLENTLAEAYERSGQIEKAAEFDQKALDRRDALTKYCWDEEIGFYRDFHWKNAAFTDVLSTGGMFPFFVGMAEGRMAAPAAKTLQDSLLRPGGVLTTQRHTGQQWDAPNGWAPLQWVSISGLRNYGQSELATEIKNRWVTLNLRVYENTGKMVEKYNVEDMSLEAGGGEYPVQDGFGWTNGVLLSLLMED